MAALEVLKAALEEKAFGWEAIKAIALQYGYEWTDLGLEGKPEPTSANKLKQLIKELEAEDDTLGIEPEVKDVTAAPEFVEPVGDVTLLTEGVTQVPGQPDHEWFLYRREDGTTFRSVTKL